MIITSTLFRYITRVYLAWLFGAWTALFGIAYLVETVELLRRSARAPELGLWDVLTMAALKAPATALEALPFVVLGATLGAFWQLNRFSELVVARASGVSAWQFLLPALASVLLVSALRVGVLDPLIAAGMARFAAFEQRYLNTSGGLVAATANGLWIRQPEPEGYSIVHAASVEAEHARLRRVSIYSFSEEDRFVRRIDAPLASLGEAYWDLEDAWISAPHSPSRHEGAYRLPTTLSFRKIAESFAPPATISFWALPRYIEALEATGFSARQHRLQLHRLYAVPLQLAGMVLLAGAFAMRHQRTSDTFLLIGAGGALGFLLYFLSYFVFNLGLSASVPLVLAAWTPAGIGVLLGGAMLLHLEDG